MITLDNLYINLRRWKEIIVLNLKSAFYQNDMHPDTKPYVGIMILFDGL